MGKEIIPVDGSLRKEMGLFTTHFERLLGQQTDKIAKETRENTQQWIDSIPSRLEGANLEKFVQAVRRWTGIYARDKVPDLNTADKRRATSRFSILEKMVSPKGAPLAQMFCLDEELTATTTDASAARIELLALKLHREEMVEFSEELERQYLQRIREAPAAGDRLLPYAYFLFSVGRLDDADEQVRQAQALTPNLKGLADLASALGKARALENAIERARYIRAFIDQRRIAAEGEYQGAQRKGTKPTAPPQTEPEPSSRTAPQSEFRLLPKKRE